MLEESRMDKKSSNRNTPLQSRASAIDCKKNAELAHKPWTRNNKKREGSGSAPKNEPYRKNGPAQRGRGPVERKPRTRGSSGFNVGGAQNTGLEDDDEPEIGSVFVPGSKKQNLNHLLNFMYPARGGADNRAPHLPPARRPVQRLHRHEHDLYLRAYCQFVLKDDGNYNANLVDPDLPVQWDQIEEIIVRSTGSSECPICLGSAAAGRAGPCGHVYCWACLMHYAAASDKQPPPCPVCTAPLHVTQMKPARRLQWDPPSETVTMRLVRRLRGSTTVEVAPPRGELTNVMHSAIMPFDKEHSAPYAKFFTATKKQVQEILQRERKEIKDQILAEIDTTEIVFMEEALELLSKKEEQINNRVSTPEPKVEESNEEAPIVYEKPSIVHEKKIDWFDMEEENAVALEALQDNFEDLDIDDVDSNLNPNAPSFVLADDLNVNKHEEEFPLIECDVANENSPPNDDTPSLNEIDKQNQSKYFYFYQADDGQQVFLNSLNVRILNASWGALSAAPPTISGRVLHRDTLPLTEQTRKHMPCTAHLPLNCSFDIVEMELLPPFVTTAALHNFAEELSRRARTRARVEREERRRERAARRATEAPPRPDFSSEALFPAALSPPEPPANLVVPPDANTPPVATGPGPSFAKMASTSGTWRVRKVSESLPVEEDEGAAPRALSLSDAIQAALHAAPSQPAKKGKKTKQKPKVLFATGMQRNN